MDLVTKSLQMKSFNVETRTADFVASTDVVDSYGEVIDQQSWRLEDFRANPVVLYAHQSRELPIGKSVETTVAAGKLEARIQFATAEMNPKAEQVWKLLQNGFLRAVSVGFLPTNGRYEMRNGQDVWVWTGSVLKEISVTPVPANPEALAKMKALFGGANDAARAALLTTLGPEQIKSLEAPGAKDSPATSPEGTKKTDGDVERKAEAMDLKELQEKHDKQVATIAELRVEAKAVGDRATKAEEALAAEIATTKMLATEKAALEAQTKSLAEARDKAEARAKEFEAKAIEQEVEALVGAKITPAEKPLFVDLRKSNPELFARMIEQRAPLDLTKQVVARAKPANSDDLLAELNGGAK